MSLLSIAQTADAPSAGIVSDTDYLAVVVDNNDPDKLQRVKVTLPGLLEYDSPADLPWLSPAQASLFGIGDNYGVVRVPRIGAKVFVRFGADAPRSGVYFGDAVTSRTQLPSELTTNYPNRVGWVDPSGSYAYADLQDKTFRYTHSSGTSVEVLADGTLRIHCVKDMQTIVDGDYTLSVGGTYSATVSSDAQLSVGGARTTTVQGNDSLSVQGSASHVVSSALTTSCSSHTHLGRLLTPDDVVAAGHSLSNHIHGGVKNGSGFTAPST